MGDGAPCTFAQAPVFAQGDNLGMRSLTASSRGLRVRGRKRGLLRLALASMILSSCSQARRRLRRTPRPRRGLLLRRRGGHRAERSSGNGHNGTISGATWTTGHDGGALSFDGTSASVDLGALGTFYQSGFTLEAWVKKQSAKKDVGVVGSWNGAARCSGSTTSWRLPADDESASPATSTRGKRLRSGSGST